MLVAFGLANVMSAIPLTPGGLGVVEAVLIPSLIGFGTPPAVAAVGVVVYRLISFWLPIPIGLAAYSILQRRPVEPMAVPGLRRTLDDLLSGVPTDPDGDRARSETPRAES